MKQCKSCGREVEGRKEYCTEKCKVQAKTERQRKKREAKILEIMGGKGRQCENCGHDALKSLFFYHPLLSGTEISNLLINKIDRETLEILEECKLICRNCYWENYYG